jgi:hypothetical protein
VHEAVKRRTRPPPVAALLLALVAVAGARPARAHIELVPTLVNRYLTLDLREDRLHLQLSLLYGDLPALEERRRMDGDGDGRLSEREIGQARRAFARSAPQLLGLRIDGAEVKIAPTATLATSGQNAVSPTPLQLDLTAVLELPPGTRRLEVMMGPDLPRMGETELVLDPGQQWRLLASESPPGRPTATPATRFTFPAGSKPTSEGQQLAFVLAHEPGGPPANRGRLGVLGAILGALVLAAIALAAARLRSSGRDGHEHR